MKAIKDLTFTDDFMFGEIMKNEEICKGVIERLLHIKIEKLELITLQETIAPYYETRGVRFDVYVKDSDKVYDIEIQNKKFTEIEKRTRYYQSMLDIDMLAKGANFRELKESYVIFICKTDPFDLGEPCYKVKSIFENHPEKEFDDKTHKLFYNASAYKKENDQEIYAFLHYISTNVPGDDFTAGIFKSVEKAKENEQFRSDYMRCNIHDFDIMEEAKTEAKLEAARNMILTNLGTLEQIAAVQALPLETVQQLAKELAEKHN